MTATDRPEALPAALEGALIAHGRLIGWIAAHLAGREGLALVDEIERRLVVRDGAEDPGAVPDRAFAVERAADAEIRRLLRLARDAAAHAGEDAGA